MVLPLAAAHTFYASQGGRRNSDLLRVLPTKTKIFCTVYDYMYTG